MNNIIIAGIPDFYKFIFKRIPDDLHGRRYEQEHAAGDERTQTQALFADPIIEQQGK